MAASTETQVDKIVWERALLTQFTLSTRAWMIQYDEVRPDTIIRTAALKDLPAHGGFAIEPETGRALMSGLVAEDDAVRANFRQFQ